MRTLILGGTGLISTSITRQLLDLGYDVWHFNRGRSTPRENFPRPVHTLQGDRKSRQCLADAVGNFVHAGSGPTAVIDMIGYTPDDMDTLLHAVAGRVGRVLFCSTVDVYDKPYVAYPVREDHPRGRVPTQYGRDKTACENAFFRAGSRGDFEAVVLRPAHTYAEGHAIVHSFGWDNRLFTRIRDGKPIICHGDGTSLWAACHADDVAEAFVAALTCPRAPGKGYTLATDEWLTFDDYYRTLARAIRAPEPRLVHIPSELLLRWAPQRAGICEHNFKYSNVFDISLARQDLRFAPRIRLEEGFRRMHRHLLSRGGLDERPDPDYDAVLERWARLTA